ncbi:MAG: alpha/beta hydrolase [Syntrophus sp. (in: bacteria)]|nr:alpha/beta hydrolase [Syntrophus sp. (in: bacteria)]
MRARQWPVISESRVVDTSYGSTFVRISGPAAAPPLVLLSGAGATSLMWIPNIEALSERYKTYAVDNIYDYGRSVYTRTLKGSDDFVKWLDELFSLLELGDAINLMGMSYGGWIVSQYALRFPHRLDKIVLLAPAGMILSLRLMFMIRLMLAMLPYRYFTRSFMYWLFKDLANRNDVARMLLREAADDTFMASRCFKIKRFVMPTVLTDRELQNIKVPALYLVGENEKIYSARKAVERFQKVAPWIQTGLIPKAGHALHVEQPEMVNSLVCEFLRG